MSDRSGSLVLAACFALVFAARAAAQPQPTIAAAPDSPEFMSRYDFHLSIARLIGSTTAPTPRRVDDRVSWDSHFGGSFDFADLVTARLGVLIDYQAVMGSEYRPFDPNQGNYTMEGFISARVAPDTEIAGIFHHVSRHLSDRPTDFAVAYNEIGARVLTRTTLDATTVDLAIEGGRAVQHSFVDYTWLGEGQVQVRHPLNGRVALFAHGVGQAFAVDEAVAGRGTQAGGLLEGGVRVTGRGGLLEVFAGYERRVDAFPVSRVPQRWALAGFRLLSR